MTYRYHNPVAIEFGAQSIGELRATLGGRRAALVTFPEARDLGLVDRLQSVLGASLVHVEEHVQPNPDVQELGAMYESFWRDCSESEAIVALGGGSAIDTAKVLMVGTQTGHLDELISVLETGRSFTPNRVKALIAVPTTAGTGSEVTPWATVWDRASGRKHSLHLRQTWPEAAIVDPELMLTLPASVTLPSGLDALSHALEAIWNVNANPISDTFAVAAARGVLATLPALMAAPQDLELRSAMALAALQAGLAFSNTKTALAHSISYEMTLRHGLTHGLACSFTLPMILDRVIGLDPRRDALFSVIFDGDLASAPQRLSRFLGDLGVRTEFADYGVSDEESARMVRDALDGVRGRNFFAAAAWSRG